MTTSPENNDMIDWRTKCNYVARATTTPQINDTIGSMRKNNRAARAACTLTNYFDVICETRTWKF